MVSKLDPAAVENGPLDVEAAVAASLARLNVDRLWGFMLHHEEMFERWDEDLGRRLRALRQNGTIGHLGISVYSTEAALRAVATDGIDLLQIPANLFDRRMHGAGVFSTAAERGVRVFVRSVYLQGLALMEVENVPGGIPDAADGVAAFETFCRERGLDRRKVAIDYVAHMAPEAVLVLGAETAAQVRDNCRLVEEQPTPGHLIEEWSTSWPAVQDPFADPRSWPEESA